MLQSHCMLSREFPHAEGKCTSAMSERGLGVRVNANFGINYSKAAESDADVCGNS
jgi:hypothetical protein